MENDKAIGNALGLQFDKAANRQHVCTLGCTVCMKFAEFHAFIDRSTNLRASSFKGNAKTDVHTNAMTLIKKAQTSDVTEHAPTARALCTMDSHAEETLKRKFDVAYILDYIPL